MDTSFVPAGEDNVQDGHFVQYDPHVHPAEDAVGPD
jgi:hypothetical protein